MKRKKQKTLEQTLGGRMASRPAAPKPGDEDDDSDEAPLATPARSQPRLKQRRLIIVDDEEEEEDDEDEDLPIAAPRSARGRKKTVTISSSDEDEDDDSAPPTKKRRLVRKGTVDASSPPPGSVRKSGKKGGKKAAQEFYRRVRAGEKIEQKDISSSDEEKGALYDSDSDFLALDKFDDEELDEDDQQPSSPMQRVSKSKGEGKEKATQAERPSEQDSDDEDDMAGFIDEDDGNIGAPAELLGIPLEFTSAAHKRESEFFSDIVEWLVHDHINASFNTKQDVHELAFRKFNRTCEDLAKAHFISDAWKSGKQGFNEALRARPYIEHWVLPRGDDDRLRNCFACGRSNHPADHAFRFRGKPYDKATLKDIDEDEDSDEGSDEASDDDDDRSISSENVEDESFVWLLGRTCAENAEHAHNLLHWKRALQQVVIQELDRQGLTRAEKCKERETMSVKKRNRKVDRLVASWEADGVIGKLYTDFKKMLDAAEGHMARRSRG